jgi:2-oxoglutarate dehydrogenase E2 component (dihydrolipoamide succinyltransferase)
MESNPEPLSVNGAGALAEPDPDAAGDAFAAESLRAHDDTQTDEAPAELAPQPEPPNERLNPADTLSPAVRRLVRQYDLDITGVHGTGPAGRIRVSDVIGMLGSRTDAGARTAEAARAAVEGRDDDERPAAPQPFRTPEQSPTASAFAAPPATTVFECDLSRVLGHRKQQRRNNAELLLTSYYLAACIEALKAVPEVAPGRNGTPAALGVWLHSSDGDVRTTLIEPAEGSAADEQLRALDQALRADGSADLANAGLLLHHYGLSGSLLATPTPLGEGHAASLGVGRVRREVVVKNTDGEEAPRVAAMCYVTLTYAPDRIPLARANRFLAHLVRTLESWPD